MEIARRVAARQNGTITLDQARAAGFTVDEVHQLCRKAVWRRIARQQYFVWGSGRNVPRMARIRAAVASLGPDAVAVLDTAAELHGLAGLPATESIHVSLPPGAARSQRSATSVDPSITAHQLVIPAAEIIEVDGIGVTNAVRTAADVILRNHRFASVAFVDSALNCGLLAPDDLAAVTRLLRGRRGCVDARRYLTEVDGRAQSPLETRVRLRSVDGKVPPDDLQHVVRDEDGFVLATGDLAWLGARIIGEADGRTAHDRPDALYRDRRRQNQLINAGWLTVRFTWADTVDPGYVPYVIRSAMRARRASLIMDGLSKKALPRTTRP